jgi:hypothetical protein
VITVTPSARRREDRAGDPLEGLVNLFDLGIVLSVAFLLAALSALHLGPLPTRAGPRPPLIRVNPGERLAPLPRPGRRVVGRGVPVGVVYRLANGELVYVQRPPGGGR